jgi:hypothetical protein
MPKERGADTQLRSKRWTVPDDAEDFQAVGVKCHEALLALVRENRDAS